MGIFFLSEYRDNTHIQVTDVCDFDIAIVDDGTTATKIHFNQSSVCFMNRPMTYIDGIHLHGMQS